MIIRILVLPLLSACLYWLSSPASSFPLVVWVCLVPLGLSLRGTSPAHGFAGGFAYGFFFWLFAVWWIRIPFVTMVGLPPSQAWGLAVTYFAFHAVPYGLFGYLAGRFRLMETFGGTVFAAVSLTVIRSWYPHVFFGSEAHNLYAWPLLIQVLDLGGSPLLLFLIYLVNFQIVRTLTARSAGGSLVPALATILLAVAFLTGYGAFRLHGYHEEMNEADRARQITVLSIQPNIPVKQHGQDVAFEDRHNNMGTVLSMAGDEAGAHLRAELIVLPELPFTYNCRTGAGRDIPPLAKETGRAIMVPCISPIGDSGKTAYNSVLLFDGNGMAGEEYRKLLLVPFGEYIPLERQFPFLRRVFPGVMSFARGNRGEVVYDFGHGRRLIPCLCYEAIFPDHIGRFVRRGGNVLINMVDDAWFGRSPASMVHMSLALFRTVEYRIPMVRTTNSGVSVFVEATGEISPGSKTPLFRKAATSRTLYIPPGRSPYTVWGDAFLWGLTAIFVVGLVRVGRG